LNDQRAALLSGFGAFGLALVGALHAVVRGPAWLDSAFVSFRYGDHFTNGHGLVFNLGERVEGFGDPLWTVFWAVLQWFGVDPVVAMSLVAPLLVFVLILATAWLSVRLAGERTGLLAPAIMAVWAPLSVAAQSGTDAVFVASLLLFTLISRVRDEGRSGHFWLVLLALSGLPGVVLAVLLAGWGAWRSPGASLVRLFVVGASLATLSWLRIGYYGEMIPNHWLTVVFGGAEQWVDGGKWCIDLCTRSPVLSMGTLLGIGVALRGRAPLQLLLVVLFLCLFWIIGQGPRRGMFFAHFVLVLPVISVLVAVLVAGICTRFPRHGFLLSLLVFLAFGAVDGLQNHRRAQSIVEQRVKRASQAELLGRFFAFRFKQGERVAVHQPGMIPYFSRGPVLDLSGKTDRVIARRWRADDATQSGLQQIALDHALVVRPAVIVHPKRRGGVRPKRLDIPKAYPSDFAEHYSTTSFTPRKRWDLMPYAGRRWLHFFVRRGIPMGHDDTKWYPMDP
jgi:hypothetical protein